MAESDVRVNFIGDASSFSRAATQVQGDLTKTSGSLTTSGGHFKQYAGVAGLAIGGLAIKLGKDSVGAFREAHASQARLQDAFSRFPAMADTNVKSLQNLNSQLERKTKFDDDALASGQATLAQYGLTGQQVSKLTPLLADYAAKTGKDIPTAAQELGKAMLGKGRALAEVGIKFKDAGSVAANYAQVTDGLKAKVGGFAVTQEKAAGGVDVMKNQFGELEEKVGSKLVPAMTKLAAVGLSVIDFISRNSAVIGPLVGVLGTLAAIIYVIITAQKIWTAVMLAWNIVVNANPISLIIIGLVALVAAIILAYKHSETFRDIVQGAFAVVGAAFQVFKAIVAAVFGWISEHWPLLLVILTGPIGAAVLLIAKHWSTIKEGVGTLVSGISTVFSAVEGVLTAPFRAAFSIIAALWNNTIGKLSFTVPSWVPGIGGKSFNMPQLPTGGGSARRGGAIPGLAGGGIVMPRFGGTLALLGEAGYPEAVIPLRGGLGRLGGPYGSQQAPTRVQLEWAPGSSGGDELLTWLAKQIRIQAGGNVQAALGS